MKRLNLFFLLVFLNVVPSNAESQGNSTCVAVVQNAVTALSGFTNALGGTNSQVASITNNTVPEILDALKKITQQIALTTAVIEDRTTRTYLVGTIALGSFALVIVGAATLAVWQFSTTKFLVWRQWRSVRQLAEQTAPVPNAA